TEVDRVRIDSKENFDHVITFAERFIPDVVPRIEHYAGDGPIFDLYGAEDEMQKALTPRVNLKSGGYLIVEQTEAMVTVDVNTGGYVGTRNPEDTIFKTNLEAAQALARQLRLRNLGGIIIIDFIDMHSEEHREQVLKALQKHLDHDPARTMISGISPLGLVEMTRKRTRESLEHMLCEPCQHCGGRGFMKSVETVCHEILREVMRSARQFESAEIMVLANPDVIGMLLDELSTAMAELENYVGKPIKLQSESLYQQEVFDVVLA
ncbi:MAG: ribonuclease E/G, partial [Nevskiales bacterium]